MKPAPPVTRMRIRRSVCAVSPAERTASAVLRLLAHRAWLAAVRLELLGALEIGNGLVAAAELVERVAEVVVRVALVRICRAGPGELLHRLLQERERVRVVALSLQREAVVVECVAVGRADCRRWRR